MDPWVEWSTSSSIQTCYLLFCAWIVPSWCCQWYLGIGRLLTCDMLDTSTKLANCFGLSWSQGWWRSQSWRLHSRSECHGDAVSWISTSCRWKLLRIPLALYLVSGNWRRTLLNQSLQFSLLHGRFQPSTALQSTWPTLPLAQGLWLHANWVSPV